jgi:hypothetical protein
MRREGDEEGEGESQTPTFLRETHCHGEEK